MHTGATARRVYHTRNCAHLGFFCKVANFASSTPDRVSMALSCLCVSVSASCHLRLSPFLDVSFKQNPLAHLARSPSECVTSFISLLRVFHIGSDMPVSLPPSSCSHLSFSLQSASSVVHLSHSACSRQPDTPVSCLLVLGLSECLVSHLVFSRWPQIRLCRLALSCSALPFDRAQDVAICVLTTPEKREMRERERVQA